MSSRAPRPRSRRRRRTGGARGSRSGPGVRVLPAPSTARRPCARRRGRARVRAHPRDASPSSSTPWRRRTLRAVEHRDVRDVEAGHVSSPREDDDLAAVLADQLGPGEHRHHDRRAVGARPPGSARRRSARPPNPRRRASNVSSPMWNAATAASDREHVEVVVVVRREALPRAARRCGRARPPRRRARARRGW